MTENCKQYFNDNDLKTINDFIEEKDNNHRFLNIYFNENNQLINDYFLECMKNEYKDDCLVLSEEELEEFERVDRLLGMTPDIFGEIENDEPENNIDDENNFHENHIIWENYLNLFNEKKIVILPRIINKKNNGIFKSLLSSFLMYTSVINNEMVQMVPHAKIIVLNKIKLENLVLEQGIKKRVIKTNILSEKEIMDKNEKQIESYRDDLIEKTWHPNRFREWCLSIDELNDLI